MDTGDGLGPQLDRKIPYTLYAKLMLRFSMFSVVWFWSTSLLTKKKTDKMINSQKMRCLEEGTSIYPLIASNQASSQA